MYLDTYTKLALNMEGENNSTSFTDLSSSALTVTAFGSSHVDTSTFAVGSASLACGSTYPDTDGLRVAYNAVLALTTDFTIKFYFKCASMGYGTSLFFVKQVDGDNNIIGLDIRIFYSGSAPQLKLEIRPTTFISSPDISDYIDDAWHSFEANFVSGDPPTINIYIDDVLFYLGEPELMWDTSSLTGDWIIGGAENAVLHMDDFEFSNGVIRTEGSSALTEDIDDTFDISEEVEDSLIPILYGILNEALYINDWVPDAYEGSISEFLGVLDNLLIHLSVPIGDAFAVSDSATASLQLLIREYLQIAETHLIGWTGTIPVYDSLSIQDFTSLYWTKIITEGLELGDASTLDAYLQLLESLGFSDLISSTGALASTASDGLVIEDILTGNFVQIVTDILGAVDVASVAALFLNNLADAFSSVDAISGLLTHNPPISDTLMLADASASQAMLFNIVQDMLDAGITIEMNGEVWECYVLNTPKFLPSIYSGFDFNSYCVFENKAYGFKSDGIYELSGDTDNGVAFHTGTELPPTIFGIPNQKRLQKAYVGCTSSGNAVFYTETDTGAKLTYTIDSVGEVDGSRSVKGRKWVLKVADFDGLDFIYIIPVVLTR